MRRTTLLTVFAAFLLVTSTAAAEKWRLYSNDRFAYAIEIPPGFSEIVEPDNGDGGSSTSVDGRAELRVWGGYILDGEFADEVTRRMADDRAEGWSISCEARRGDWASWSGTRGSAIFYQRAIQGCDGAAAYFRLDYSEDQRATYDPVVARLVSSLRAAC